MKKGRRWLSAVAAAIMALCMVPAIAFAEEENVVNISDSQGLIDAINNQQDGQTWVLAEGTYDIADGCLEHEANIGGVVSGFVFQIHANNLTIKGSGDVTITSTYEANSGIWSAQNFITVSGSGVTIQDVKLQGNRNAYYDGCNKVLELAGAGKDLTLKNVDCLALTDADGKKNSGSIYINVADAGNTVLEDVTLASWINARAVTAGTVTAKNVTQDFTNNTYAGYTYGDYGYAWNPGISGENVVLDGFTIKVDEKSEFVQQIVKNLKPGTTIELMSDIKLSEELYINSVDQITIKGNGHTITAADDFKMNLEGQIQLVKIEADGVTLDDVKLVATDKNKHTLDIWGADNVVLNNVVLDHSKASSGAPLVINSSKVAVTGSLTVVTGDKPWYGVDLDNKNGDASLTFEKDSSLIFTDESSEQNKVLIFVEKSNAEGNAPVLESNSENVFFEKNEDGTVANLHTEHTYENGKCTVCGKADPNGEPPSQTGENNIFVSAVLLFISGAAVIALVAFGKKKRTI